MNANLYELNIAIVHFLKLSFGNVNVNFLRAELIIANVTFMIAELCDCEI